MNFDIIANYDNLINANKDSHSFLTESEELTLQQIAYAVESLVMYDEKVSLVNIKIITDIPTSDLEDFISFILNAQDLAEKKYKDEG